MNKLYDEIGVAITKEICPICCKEIDGPLLIGKKVGKNYAEKVNAMHGKPIGWAKKPCPECMEHIKNGCFFIIGVDGTKTTDNNNPYRSGHIVGITKDCDFYKMLPEEAKKAMAMYMDYRSMKECGLINDA